MSYILRPYQEEIISKARNLMQTGNKTVLIQSPTGSGKTLLTAYMLKSASAKGMSSWFIVHRRELIHQSMKAFEDQGIKFGVVAAGFQHNSKPLIQICSIQTLANRLSYLKNPNLIVYDESHHITANSWSKIYSNYPKSFHIGLTATPQRLDGAGLGKYFSQMIEGPKVSWLIDNKFLSPYKIFAPPSINTEGVHTRMGDFIKSELTTIADKPSITGDAIRHYNQHAKGKRALVFAVSIEHSKHIASQFNASGILAEHVDGDTPAFQRDLAINKFRSNIIKVISNVDLFGEGFDLPSLECAILLRPTMSLALYLQMCGRSLRPNESKEHAIILDHAGNCQRHGLPCEERQWSLEGKLKKSTTSDTASVRTCPACYAAQPPFLKLCKHCGYVFEVQSRQVEVKDGELQEINIEVARKQKRVEQGRAMTFDELVALGKARGYKRPFLWAKYVFNSRQAKKLKDYSTATT